MKRESTPNWQSEALSDQSDGIRQMLELTEAKAKELEAAWIEFNKAQQIGQPHPGAERDKLVTLTNELSEELPFLESRFDSDSLERTNNYLIVLAARQTLDYSRDQLGMV